MGNELVTLKKAGKDVDPTAFFTTPHQNIHYCKQLRKNKLFFTILGTVENEWPVIVKTYIRRGTKKGEGAKMLEEQYRTLESYREIFPLYKFPNLMPCPVLVLEPGAALLIRQYFPFNLKQRINSIPYLKKMDKLWFSFQLLYAVFQIHSQRRHHGDLKAENIMVTSWDWLYVVDFAPFKPTYIPADDFACYKFFFAPESKKQACYIAPERLVGKTEDTKKKAEIEQLQLMDIFSLGCVIAEIFLNHPIFELQDLSAYKQGKFSLDVITKNIKNRKIGVLIKEMLNLDPARRKSAEEYLRLWSEQVFPSSFISLFYSFIPLLSRLPSSDEKLALIYQNLHSIWNICFSNSSPPFIPVSINHEVFEKTREVNFDIFQVCAPKFFEVCNRHTDYTVSRGLCQNNHSSIILIHMLGMIIRSCRYPSSRIVALQILRKLAAQHGSPKIILQYLLPYHISCLKDECDAVVVEALYGTLDLFNLGIEATPSQYEYKIFSRYIFSELSKLLKTKRSIYAMSALTGTLGKFALLGRKLMDYGLVMHMKYFRCTSKKDVSQYQNISILSSYDQDLLLQEL